jgi:hypothetical protein
MALKVEDIRNKKLVTMKSATNSLKVFGIYRILIPGIGFMAVPDIILDRFQLSYGEELR